MKQNDKKTIGKYDNRPENQTGKGTTGQYDNSKAGSSQQDNRKPRKYDNRTLRQLNRTREQYVNRKSSKRTTLILDNMMLGQ